jgi:hypothetical protein
MMPLAVMCQGPGFGTRPWSHLAALRQRKSELFSQGNDAFQ